MKTKKIKLLLTVLSISSCIIAQKNVTVPDLSKAKDPGTWKLYNRDVGFEDEAVIKLNGKPGDGMLWYRDLDFRDGRIECDIKGQDIRGRSFVGLAFHGQNDSIYDAVYFRPFNFLSEERKGHSVQYISQPVYTWNKLRGEHPGKYENKLDPVPVPDEWFHATIIIDYPTVEVYVNDSDEPCLQVTQLSSRKHGWLGLWVGNNSEGSFKNLKITTE